MVNLLPPEEKEALKIKKNKRLIIVLGIIILSFLVCLILVLASLDLYILGQTSYQRVALDNAEKKYETPGLVDMKNMIVKYNTALTNLKNFYKKEVYFSEVLKTILQIHIPAGLYLTNINLTQGDNGKVKVALSGMSDTRDNLQIFRDSFENNKKIENLDFPANNWIKPTDINFYFTFEVGQP